VQSQATIPSLSHINKFILTPAPHSILQAEFVVSGDRHLLALKQHANITMISLADFLTKLPR
jgi:predicted nucleic acid-binding protein